MGSEMCIRDRNTNARNATKDIEIEIDDAYGETEVNDEENDKKNYEKG